MILAPIGMDEGLIPPRATGVAVIDLAQVRANWKALAALVEPAECAAVVKADAYGLGAAHVIPALVAAGCRTFFVATAEEAQQARALASEAAIYVLDGVLDGAFLRSVQARPVVADAGELAVWASLARDRRERAPCAIQIETGLNRRGIDLAGIRELAQDAATLDLVAPALAMSHLACADDPGHELNPRQRGVLLKGLSLLPGLKASLAASDGLMLGRDYHFDLVRPGYAIYGGQAFRGKRAPVLPVLRAYARVLQVREVAAGQTVGYSATWTARSARMIATIAAGYADGVFRHASSGDGNTGGFVAVNAHLCPIVGRISMDLVTADVTEAARSLGGLDRLPGWVELIGPSLSLEQVGAHAGTIGYEVLTRLGRRYHRVYVGGER